MAEAKFCVAESVFSFYKKIVQALQTAILLLFFLTNLDYFCLFYDILKNSMYIHSHNLCIVPLYSTQSYVKLQTKVYVTPENEDLLGENIALLDGL